MSERQLPNWIDGYLEYIDDLESPDLFKLWSGLSVISGALQRKCYLQFFSEHYPNTFVVFVGPSGTRKSEAVKITYDMLSKCGVKITSDAATIESMVKTLKRNTDTAVSKLGNILMHSSMTIVSSELAVFIGYNNPKLISYLTDWYDCKSPWIYETISRGEEDIHGICVSLLGATTPDLLKSILPQDAIGGGLTSRMIFVFGDKKSKVVSDPIQWNKPLRARLAADLEQIVMLQGEFTYTEEFRVARKAWHEMQETHPPFTDPNFDGYRNRRVVHNLKLCMLCNAARSNDMVLDVEDFHRALFILEETEKKMLKTLQGYGRNEYADIMSKVMGYISARKELTMKDLMENFYRDLSKDELMKILATLEVMKFCKMGFEGTTLSIRWTPKEATSPPP